MAAQEDAYAWRTDGTLRERSTSSGTGKKLAQTVAQKFDYARGVATAR